MANKSLSNLGNLTKDGHEMNEQKSIWNNLINFYEIRNASLERQHNELAERVRIMELALPNVLLGDVVVGTNNFTMDEGNIMTELTKDNCQYCTLADHLRIMKMEKCNNKDNSHSSKQIN